MKDNISFVNLLNIYESEISKNVKNKKKLVKFEINKVQNITNIIDMLNRGKIGHEHYNIFLIYEPKCRLIMSLSIKDKIINHFVTRYALEAKLTKYLDLRNVATRKGMGTDYGIRLVIKYLKKLKSNKFYILKIDISKYFYSIDHEVLKSLLIDKRKKTKIVSCKEGFSFLGYIFKVIDKKLVIKIKRSNLEKIKKRVKQVRYLLDRNKISHYRAFCSIMTYSNCYKYASNIKVLKLIDRYFFHEK